MWRPVFSFYKMEDLEHAVKIRQIRSIRVQI